jgi:hypothetical protein
MDGAATFGGRRDDAGELAEGTRMAHSNQQSAVST